MNSNVLCVTGRCARVQGTFSALRSIAQQEGLAGIYRGIGPTILTNAPFSALYYMFYTGLKQRLQSVRPLLTAS